MKNIIKAFIAIMFIAFSFTACSSNKNDNQVEDNANAEGLAKKEQEKLEKQKQDSINSALNAIQVRIFEHGGLAFDMEGWCLMPDNSATITEVKDFNKTKNHNCKKGNYIQKLTIDGEFKGIDIKFLDKKDKTIKEFSNYDLKKSVSYSDINYQPVNQQEVRKKDEFYQDWFEKASKIQLVYKDSVFYSASWKSNGWVVQ